MDSDTLKLTPLIMRLCLFERFQHGVDAEREMYAKKLQSEEEGRLEALRQEFINRREENRRITEVLPIPNVVLQESITIVQRAMRTGQLEDL